MSTSVTVTEVAPQMETLHMKLLGSSPNKNAPHPPKMKNRIRLDPSRALEPARKKISTLEAQRVMSVFEDTIKRVEIVTLIPYIIANLNRFTIALGSEIVDALSQHSKVQTTYEEIKEQLEQKLQLRIKSASTNRNEQIHIIDEDDKEKSLRPDSEASIRSTTSIDSQTESLMRSLSMVAQQVSHSCKNILRLFSTSPASVNAVRAEISRRSRDANNMLGNMTELRDILMGKLLTTPVEEREKMEYLYEISQRERNNAVIIEKMEAELNSAINDKDDEIKKKNDIIRRLQADLHQIEKFSEEHIRRVKSEAEKQESSDIKNSEGKRLKLQTEVAQLKSQVLNLTSEHRENEQEFRRKKYKIETEVENWIQKYDQDMGERQDEYEQIDAVYTEEKKQLHELEERFKTLEEEYIAIMEERRIAREKREAAERELAIMVRAATTIQAFWRSFKVRKALKSKKKKKGGKKKK